jgi:hypothetical protein
MNRDFLPRKVGCANSIKNDHYAHNIFFRLTVPFTDR